MTEDRRERVKRTLEELKKAVEELCNLLDCDSDVINEGTVAETKVGSAYDEEKVIFKEITTFLHDIGMPSNVKGFHYARYAIQLAVQDFSLTNAITKGLYPKVAERFGTTNTRAERSIGNAIDITWKSRNVAKYEELFGKSVNRHRGKPTNSEFIATVADHIRLKNGKI